MMLLGLSILLLLTSLRTTISVQIGLIQNLRWDQTATITRNDIVSCDECVCIMLQSFSTVLGLNCYLTNRTCQLFTNYSSEGSMRVSSANCTFYFLVLPTKITYSTLTTEANELQMTTESRSFTEIFWPFDNDTRDTYGVYNGIIINNASYVSPGITGYGSSLVIQADLYQYVNVSSPALNLSNTSFTFEVWIKAASLDTSYFYGLIGQCTSSSANQCLHLALRDGQPFLGFFENDCVGQTVLNSFTWYHIAFVYSFELRRQTIYLNGYIDGEKYSADPYQGSGDTALTIGMILPAEIRSFNGQIGQMSFVNRAKSDTEILDDATLVVHYSFDSNLVDSGPMRINATGNNISFVNQAVEFVFSSSNVQATGFTLLGTSNWPYSIALWIYPYSTAGGCLLDLWNMPAFPTWCLPLLGLSTSGSVVAQQYNGSSVVSISSNTIPSTTWTHIVYTYSINIGIQLYINGTLVNTSTPFYYSAMSQPASITLGFNSAASSQSECDWQPNFIHETQYYGLIDEFYLYSRQLTFNEIQTLATR